MILYAHSREPNIWTENLRRFENVLEIELEIGLEICSTHIHLVINLFFQELGSSVEGNVFVSTYSIQFLLLLLAFGSKSKTNDQLKSVLHLSKDKQPNYENIKSMITKLEVCKKKNILNQL